MVAIQNIKLTSVDETKLKQVVQQGQKETNGNQSVFGAQSYTNEQDMIKQNTAVYQNMDAATQEMLSASIQKNGASNGGQYCDFEKVEADMNKNGFSTKVVDTDGSGNRKYLEITTPDGKSFRLWDAGGDGGFGTKDINLDGSLGNFKNDVNSFAAGAIDKIPQVAGTQGTETANALTAADKTQVTAEKAKNVQDKEILSFLKADLRNQGNLTEKEIDPKAEQMLPIYRMLLSLNLPWINKLFGIEE